VSLAWCCGRGGCGPPAAWWWHPSTLQTSITGQVIWLGLPGLLLVAAAALLAPGTETDRLHTWYAEAIARSGLRYQREQRR
jgi:hypothetical protein